MPPRPSLFPRSARINTAMTAGLATVMVPVMVMAMSLFMVLAPASNHAHAGVFEDAMLRALENSTRLKQSRLNLSATYESLPQAYSGKEFGVNLSAGTGATDRKVFGVFEGSAFSADRSVDDSISLRLSRNIYDGGNTRIRVDTTKLSIQRSELSFQRDVAQALTDAIRTYVDLVTARANMRLQEAATASRSESQRSAESRFQLGDATATDTAAARADNAQAEQELLRARNRLANAESQYTLLMGEPPAILDLPPLPHGLPTSMEEMVEVGLTGNLDLRMSKLSERSERRNLDRLATRYRPSISFSASATRSGNNPEGAEKRTESDSGSASVRIDLSMPLYIPPSERASARADIYRHRSTLLGLADQTRRARVSAENTYRSYDSARQGHEAAKAALEAEKLRSREVEIAARLGERTTEDVLRAKASLMRAEIGMVEAEAQLVTAAYNVLEYIGQLSMETFGIDTPAAQPDKSRIRFPVRPLPYPVFVHPDEQPEKDK